MPKVSTAQFIACWHRNEGVLKRITADLGITESAVMQRRRQIRNKNGVDLKTTDVSNRSDEFNPKNEWISVPVKDGVVVVFSDAHYWPGEPSAAHQALLRVIKQLRPAVVIANGDVVDGASISRHDKIGWQKVPSMTEELVAVKARLGEVERAAGKARLIRTIGNHCIRFDKFLATQVAEMEGIDGFRLRDHLKAWEECWAVRLGKDTVVKHRHHNGIHAAYNNTLKGGLNVVTGHLHRLTITAWGDYTGRRYGIDTGTLAETEGPQFYYMEGSPRPWASGFAVLTYMGGKLLPPELCEVTPQGAIFRGAVV